MGPLGGLLPPTLWIGFTVVSVLLGLGLLQTVMTTRGQSLVPGLGGRRPNHAAPTVAFRAADARSATRTGPADADTRPHAARPSTARMPTRTPSTAPFETRGERPYSPGDHPPPNQTGQRRQ